MAKPDMAKPPAHDAAPPKPRGAQVDAQAARAHCARRRLRRIRQRSARKAARARTPAPNPNAPVVAGLHRDGETLQIEFPFAVPTPAAVFRRADTLWLVFDNPAKISLGKLAAESGGAIRGATVKRSKDGAAVVRIRLQRPRLISVDSDGPAWMVTIADTVTTPSKPLSIARSMVARNRANIVVPFDNPGKLHRLRDPEVGDRLLVMTGLGAGARISARAGLRRARRAGLAARRGGAADRR